jgi:hypothetical protein
VTDRGVQLGQIGAWFNPGYDDDTRTEFVIQAEKLGYPRPGLGAASRNGGRNRRSAIAQAPAAGSASTV